MPAAKTDSHTVFTVAGDGLDSELKGPAGSERATGALYGPLFPAVNKGIISPRPAHH